MAEHEDLILERTFDAPRDLVWKAWTDPEHLKAWWAPRPYETPECGIDLRPGGIFYTRMTGPDGFDSSGTGCFLDVVEGEKIVWTSALGPGLPAGRRRSCGLRRFRLHRHRHLRGYGRRPHALQGGGDAQECSRSRDP